MTSTRSPNHRPAAQGWRAIIILFSTLLLLVPSASFAQKAAAISNVAEGPVGGMRMDANENPDLISKSLKQVLKF